MPAVTRRLSHGRIRAAAVALAVVMLVALGGFVALHGDHGLRRTALGGNGPTYTLPRWGWPYFDGASFAFGDALARSEGLVLEGFVTVRSDEERHWRLRRRGPARLVIDGVVLVDDAAPPVAAASDTDTENVTDVVFTPSRDVVALRLESRVDLARARALGRYEVALEERDLLGRWRLLPTRDLWPTEPTADERRGAVKRALSVHAAAGLCVLVIALVVAASLRRAVRRRGVGRAIVWPLAVGLVAVTLRVLVLVERAAGDLSFWTPSVDADNYVMYARATLSGVSAVHGPMFAPGNTWWWIFVTNAFGPEIWKLHAANTLVAGLASAALTASAIRRLGLAVGVAAGMVFALFPPLLYYQGTLHVAGVLPSVMGLVAAAGLGAATTRRVGVWAVLGALVGVAALLRPTALALLPVLGLYAVFRRARGGHVLRRILPALALSAGAALVVAPQTALNSRSRTPSLITNSGPTNLLIGNNSGASGTFELGDAFQEARAWTSATGRSTLEATALEVVSDRRRAAELLLRKLGLVFTGPESANVLDYAGRGLGVSPTLRATSLGGWIGFTALSGLALCGAILGLGRGRPRARRAALLLVALAATYAAATALVFVEGRIRAPLAGLMAPLAGIALGSVACRRVPWRAGSIVALCAALVVAGLDGARRGLPRERWSEAVPRGAVVLEHEVADGVTLVGARAEWGNPCSGGYVVASLHWRATRAHTVDTRAVLTLVDGTGSGNILHTREVTLGANAWPPVGTSAWPVGKMLAERFFFRLPRDAPESVELRVRSVGAPTAAEVVALRYEVRGELIDLRTRFD
jgi:hypothetical protein